MREWLRKYIGPAPDGVFYRPAVFYGKPTPGQVLIMALNPKTPIYDAQFGGPARYAKTRHPAACMSSTEYLDILMDGQGFEREYQRIRAATGLRPMSRSHMRLLELIRAVGIPVTLSNYYRYPTDKKEDIPETEKRDDHVLPLINELRPALVIALCEDAWDFMDEYLYAEPAANCRPEYLEFDHPAYVTDERWQGLCKKAGQKAKELKIR